MSSRIRRSWSALAEAIAECETTDACLMAFHDWLRENPGSVSSVTARALDASVSVRNFLACPTHDLPTCLEAERELLDATSRVPASDPTAFAETIAWLCYRLRVYRDRDVCPHCQGHLEAWTHDGSEVVWICSVMEHEVVLTDRQHDEPRRAREGLHPATRVEIVRAYPDVVFARDMRSRRPGSTQSG